MVTVIVSAVVGTLVFVGLFTWMGLRAAHSAERAAHDTKYRRRMLLIGAAVYLFIAFRTLMSVLVGNQSITILLGLPILIFLAWWFLRTARKAKDQPGKSPEK